MIVCGSVHGLDGNKTTQGKMVSGAIVIRAESSLYQSGSTVLVCYTHSHSHATCNCLHGHSRELGSGEYILRLLTPGVHLHLCSCSVEHEEMFPNYITSQEPLNPHCHRPPFLQNRLGLSHTHERLKPHHCRNGDGIVPREGGPHSPTGLDRGARSMQMTHFHPHGHTPCDSLRRNGGGLQVAEICHGEVASDKSLQQYEAVQNLKVGGTVTIHSEHGLHFDTRSLLVRETGTNNETSSTSLDARDACNLVTPLATSDEDVNEAPDRVRCSSELAHLPLGLASAHNAL
jgi:hypothetical protein